MVQNDSDVKQCETPKLDAKPAITQPTVPPPAVSGGFGNMFSKPTGTWECDACMVQNKSDVTGCVACETPKPGAKPAPTMPAVPAMPAVPTMPAVPVSFSCMF